GKQLTDDVPRSRIVARPVAGRLRVIEHAGDPRPYARQCLRLVVPKRTQHLQDDWRIDLRNRQRPQRLAVVARGWPTGEGQTEHRGAPLGNVLLVLPRRSVHPVIVCRAFAERDDAPRLRRMLCPLGALLINWIDPVMQQLSCRSSSLSRFSEREIRRRTEAVPALAAVALIS